MNRVMLWTAVALMALCVVRGFAEDDEEEDNEKARKQPAAVNAKYKENCGSCHFCYPPRLLPAQSWTLIIDQPGYHAGGDLDLDAKAKSELKKFLAENSAGASNRKKSKKPIETAVTNKPVRISDLPSIRHKHEDIKSEVFSRKSIGSRGNCIACHQNAENGEFDDDNVKIPRK